MNEVYKHSIKLKVFFYIIFSLNWNTSFPAVTICELYNGEKLWDLSEMYFGVEHDLRLDDVVGEIVYFQGSCTACDICESENITCPQNFTQLLDMVSIYKWL